MNDQANAHPYDNAKRFPDGDAGSVSVDWRERLGEDMDGWTSAEAVDVESRDPGDGRTYYVVSPLQGPATRVRVDCDENGEDVEVGEWFTRDEIDARIEDNDGTEYADRLRQGRAVLEQTEEEGVDSAEGPMMNAFFVLERGGFFAREVDIDVWARELVGLPLCAVELDGDFGLALTGGGMDLSWEIAEAHLRLGYRPPSWLRLPKMAGRGESENDQAIVRAVLRSLHGAMVRAQSAFGLACEEWGVDPEKVAG